MRWIWSVLLPACGSTADAPPAAPSQAPTPPARCIRAAVGHIAERVYLDAADNVLRSKREDGSLTTTWERDHSGAVRRYTIEYGEPRRAVTGSFQFGAHGELSAARIASADRSLDVIAQLAWRGSFAAVASPIARPFAPLGGGAGTGDTGQPIQLLSADLTVRSAANPMAPVRFTGTVIVTYPGDASSDRYEYKDGKLASWRDRRGGSERLTWDASGQLTETESCTPKDPLLGDEGGCRSSATGPAITYDEQGRPIAGTYGERYDTTAWSDCPLP